MVRVKVGPIDEEHADLAFGIKPPSPTCVRPYHLIACGATHDESLRDVTGGTILIQGNLAKKIGIVDDRLLGKLFGVEALQVGFDPSAETSRIEKRSCARPRRSDLLSHPGSVCRRKIRLVVPQTDADQDEQQRK